MSSCKINPSFTISKKRWSRSTCEIGHWDRSRFAGLALHVLVQFLIANCDLMMIIIFASATALATIFPTAADLLWTAVREATQQAWEETHVDAWPIFKEESKSCLQIEVANVFWVLFWCKSQALISCIYIGIKTVWSKATEGQQPVLVGNTDSVSSWNSWKYLWRLAKSMKQFLLFFIYYSRQ